MNKIEKIILYSLLAIIIVVGLVNLTKKSNGLGAYIDQGQVSRFTDLFASGQTKLEGNFIQGGGLKSLNFATSTPTDLTASNICDNSELVVTVTNATGTTSVKVPTGTALGYTNCFGSPSPSDGSTSTLSTTYGLMKTIYVKNTGSATSTAIAANTGVTLYKSNDTGGTVTIPATSTAAITFVKTATNTFDAFVNIFTAN